MPQMSPLLWLYLFTEFSLLFLMSMVKVYFFINKQISSSTPQSAKTSTSKLNWVW